MPAPKSTHLPTLPVELPPASVPGDPTVVHMPTLGQAVQLGELYDARSASFLGAQLYPQDKMNDAITKTYNRFGDLSLTMDNTLQNKSATIDISAEISVKVLGGLISVSGSAAYFHDSKSNTQEKSWALTYKARFMEERLCFSEEALGGNVLPLIQTNFLLNNAATHFVSAIQYGGNVVVRMTARESKLEEQDKIEGKLQASFEGLKAALDVSGSVSAAIDTSLSDLNSKFDVQVYGDVALNTVPLNPEDVTVTFSEATKALVEKHEDNREGVPIPVTLQPIPASLFADAQIIYSINQTTLNHYLNEFARLEDVHARYDVLEQFAKTYKDILPDFSNNQVLPACHAFRDEYRVTLAELGDAIKKILRNEPVDNISILKKARELYERHTSKLPTSDPENPIEDLAKKLYELEPFYFRFRDFVTGITQKESGWRLRSVNEISLAARAGSSIPLVLVPPIKVGDLSITRKLIQLSFLLREKVPGYFTGVPDSCYLMYIEADKEGEVHIEDWLPSDDAVLEGPTVYSGQVSKTDGTLNWTMLWPNSVPEQDVDSLDDWGISFSNNDIYFLRYRLSKLQPRQPYTVMVQANLWNAPTGSNPATILNLGNQNDATLVKFQVGSDMTAIVVFWDPDNSYSMKSRPGVVTADGMTPCWVTFVQDVGSGQFYFYFNKSKVAYYDIPQNFKFTDEIRLCWDDYQQSMDGDIWNVLFYPNALSQSEISSIINSADSDTAMREQRQTRIRVKGKGLPAPDATSDEKMPSTERKSEQEA